MNILTVESMKGKNMPMRNTPDKAPIDADDRLIVNCRTEPSLSTTYTNAEKRKGTKIIINIFRKYILKINKIN